MDQTNASSTAGELLLAICASPEAEHGQGFASLDDQAWYDLLELARLTRTLPLIANTLHQSGKSDLVPQFLAQEWRDELRAHAIGSLGRGQAGAQVLHLLEGAGFQPIALKGMSLAFRDYPNPSLRPLRDIDLLLSAEDAIAAEQFLLDQPGFRRRPGAGSYGVEHGYQLPELEHVESGLVIELHHAINARGWAGEAQLLGFLRETCQPVQLLGQQVLLPSPKANFLHLVEHAALHHLFSNGPLVLSDMHFIATRHSLDWDKLWSIAAKAAMENAVSLLLAVAHACGARWMPQEMISDGGVPQEHIATAKLALLAGDERAREVALQQRLEGRAKGKKGPITAFLRMLRPNRYELSRHSGRRPDELARWLGYPGWLKEKGARYLRISRDSTINKDSERQGGLRRWLQVK